MSIIQRFKTTLTAQVERLVDGLENHDAVVQSGVRDARRALARAQVRHEHLRREGEAMHRRQGELEGEARAWQDRALGCDDQEQALECLSRRNRARKRAQALSGSLERHRDTQERMGRDLASIRARITRLEEQRRLLRTREATAEAASHLRGIEDRADLDLDDAFERWEVRIAETEMTVGASEETDAFERSFLEAEDRAALAAELSALRREVDHED